MPELPEVETVCQGLAQCLPRQKIRQIQTRRKNLRIPFPRSLPQLAGKKILGIRRRAKYILIDLAGGNTLLMHLGMSGRLVIQTPQEKVPREKHDHMIITLTNGTEVIFNDPRRFGLVDLSPTQGLEEHRFFKHLGPEPLDPAFTARYLTDRLAHKKTAIKTAIMDQRLVVGVGNIYAAEALFRAQISPTRKAQSLTTTENRKLTSDIKYVLKKAIAAGGSSLRDYVQTDGALGYFQHQWAVYNRTGSPCRRCRQKKALIKKIMQGGRSTFYCPHCQK